MTPSPTRKPALKKAPEKEHPLTPETSAGFLQPQPAELEGPTPVENALDALSRMSGDDAKKSAEVVAQHVAVMISARVDADLRQAVRRFGVDNDKSVQDILTEALEEYLTKHG